MAFPRETWPEGHWRVGSAEGVLARFYLTHGRFGDALPHARNQLESYRMQIVEDHTWTMDARVILGLCLLELDRFQEAEAHFLRAYGAYEEAGDREQPRAQELVSHLVTLYGGWGRPEEKARFRRLLLPAEEEGAGRS